MLVFGFFFVNSFATCEMRILPRFYDSFFIVSIQNLGLIRDQTEDLTITITGFDPTGNPW